MADNQGSGPATDNPRPEDAPGQVEGTILTGAVKSPESAAGVNSTERPAWTAQLDKELQSDAGFTKFKSISELGRSYKELEGRLGKALIHPGETATAEEWQAFYRKIGAPEKPEEYKLDASKVPKGIYSGDMEQKFRTWAHEQGLTQKQAQAIFERFNQTAVDVVKYRAHESQVAMQQADATLRNEWGPSYDENMGHVKRVFMRFGNDAVARVFARTGAGNDPGVVKLFAAIGKEIGESTLLSGVPAGSGGAKAEDLLYPSMKEP